ncbi:GFA family protein [Vibrio sp. 10N]|uniref:GFA family protein n=1 Tax=Vibrio sp. 10N TaxID=3058938 RepID=UPI00403EAE93
MITGSCQCGAVQYELLSEPFRASHCHCKMCQKLHGSAFATYVTVPKNDLRYISELTEISEYSSSAHVTRKFCRTCGSNIEWSDSRRYPDRVSVTLATLDGSNSPSEIHEIFTETAVCWSVR